ncbi:MAG: hypothetical protein PHN19_02325 [Patescibacteria group bacterium]|nr:hypothetical protein [Patescibacteria group bacterium]
MKNLEKAVLAAVSYYDIFEYPLTSWEIFKFGYGKCDMGNMKNKVSDVHNILVSSNILKKSLQQKNGFYFLKGRKDIVETRRQRYLLAQKRWKKLQRITTILQVIPFIKMIAGCNNLLINNIKPESDIDVFIVVKSGRMWITRFLVTSLVSLLGQWRHKDRISGKLCLSFFVTDDNLNLKKISKKPYDIYLNNWILLTAPLLDRGIYTKFMLENSWTKDSVPNALSYLPVGYERKIKKILFLDWLRIICERILSGKLGNSFEKIFKKIQIGKMRGKGLDVIISDKMLKFHEVDRRNEFREKFEINLNKVIGVS